MISFRNKIIQFAFFLVLPFCIVSQTEQEMKVQADKLFESGKYLEASPLYLRLLALQPRDYNYNYRYGTCLLSNSNRKQEAIKYLNFASKDPNAAPETFYYLGKALHLNYQFNEAIKQYTAYKNKIGGIKNELDVDRQIEMCQNGKRLMTTLSDLIVLDKKELTTDKFFRVYDLSDIGGTLLVRAEFQSKIDKKNGHIPLIHFPQNSPILYYSSYGDSEGTGKDIYMRRKLPDGSWGLPQKVAGGVNTSYDEDFPYMHPDGNYLYFSSKGHNTMGGYDIFRCKLDPSTNSFGNAENMDFAISSPDDDLFYVVDSLNKDAFFASARQSELGKYHVYRVKVDRVPLQLAVVKGNFSSEVDPTIKKLDLEVIDLNSGNSLGMFNSNEKSQFLITFPKGGKYEYVMKVAGTDKVFRSIVSIPFLKEFKPLKQKIVHAKEEGMEVVRVVNLFDEEVDEPQAVIAEVMKIRSNLDVNVDQFDLKNLESQKANQEILAELGLGNMRVSEVSNVLADEETKLKERKDLVQRIATNVHTLVIENAADFLRLEESIKEKVSSANANENVDNKYILLKEADVMLRKQEELKEYSAALLRLNDSVKAVLSIEKTQADLDKLQGIQRQLDDHLAKQKEAQALDLLRNNKEFINALMNDKTGDLVQNLIEKVVQIDEEVAALSKKEIQYRKDTKELNYEIANLQNELATAKKKDAIAIEEKIASKQEENALIAEENNKLNRKIDAKNAEKYQLNKQIQILQDAVSNKSLASVTKDQALKAIAETEKVNTNTLNAYVGQQLADLEEKDPSLRERIVVSSGLKAQNIYQEYKNSKQGIEDDTNLSREDKLYRLLENERKTSRQLDKRADEIAEQLKKNATDQELLKEKQALKNYQEEIKTATSSYEKQVEVLVAKDGAADPEVVTQNIAPNHVSNKKFISSNSNLTNREKLQELNKEDEQFLTQIEKELKKTEIELINQPNDQGLVTKQKTLNTLKIATEKEIDARNEELNENNITSSEPEMDEEEIKKDMLAAVDKQYNSSVEAVSNDNSLSPDAKRNKLQQLDAALIQSIDAQLKDTQNKLLNAPQDEKLKQQQKELEKIKLIKESAMDERAQELNSEVINELTDERLKEEKKELLNELLTNYEREKDKINESEADQKKKSEALIALEQKVKKSITEEKQKQTEQLRENPLDKEVNKKLAVINALEKENEENIRRLQTQSSDNVLNNKEIAITAQDKQNKLNELSPAHVAMVEAINSADLSAIDKLSQLIAEEKALLKVLNDELIRLRTVTVENKQRENQVVLLLNEETKQQLTTLEQELAKLEKETAPQPVTIAEKQNMLVKIDDGFEERLMAIDAQTSETQNEKLKQKQLEERLLLNKLYNELESLDNDPSIKTSATKQRDKLIIEALAQDFEQRIEENKILGGDEKEAKARGKEQLLNDIAPDYLQKSNAIENSQISAEEKKIKRLQLERDLQNILFDELTAVESALERDEANENKLTEKKNLLEMLKDVEKRITAIEQGKEPPVAMNSTQEKDQLIRSIDAQYFENLNAIKKNAALSDREKRKQILDVQNKLLDKVLDQKIRTREELNFSRTSTALKTKLDLLQALEDELVQSTDKEKDNLKVTATDVTNVQIKDQLLADLVPDYESRKSDVINGKLSEKKKAQQLIKLEEELIRKLDKEREELEKEMLKNPSDERMAERKNTSISMQLDAKKNIKKQQDILAQLKNPQIDKKDVVTENKTDNPKVPENNQSEKMDQIRNGAEEQKKEKTEPVIKESNAINKTQVSEDKKLQEKETINKLNEQNQEPNDQKTDRLNNDQLDAKEAGKQDVEQPTKTDQREQKQENKIAEQGQLQPETGEAKEQENFLADFRKVHLGSSQSIAFSNANAIEDLKKQDDVLAKYEREINTELNKLNTSTKTADIQKQEQWLKDELVTTSSKRRQVKITLGELEKIDVIAETKEENRFNNKEWQDLSIKETRLKKAILDPATPQKEEKKLKNELKEVQREKSTLETTLLNQALTTKSKETAALKGEVRSNGSVNKETQMNTRVALMQQKDAVADLEALKEQADDTRNKQEKNYLLQKALEQQNKINDQLKETVVQNKLLKLEEENGISSIESHAELEKKQRKYVIQIGELTKLITYLDKEIADSKPKKAESLKQERKEKIEQRELIQKQLELVNTKLAAKPVSEKTINREAINQEISFQEEQEMAATDSYRTYQQAAEQALEVEKQITNLEGQLAQEKSDLKAIVSAEESKGNGQQKEQQQKVREIKSMEAQLKTKRAELLEKQTLALQVLPANESDAMKMQNMVERGVKPIQKFAIIAALVPMPASGLEINKVPKNDVVKTAIPVDVRIPTGLIFRVQVGAFAKPIPQDLFNKFTPVSGEKIENSNITRYMAGYFNNSQKVIEAKNQIKALGYADAFAVAYCDGKRITLAEARQLEANGKCIAKGENELMMEMAVNTAEKLGLETKGVASAVSEYAYNQMPGAAIADPIEKYQGLFFTVQVGVFNQPVPAKRVANLKPLLTSRMPNGQIRYAVGVYNSIEEARPKKIEAVQKGITDAFITAYYKGQRITLAEAQELLNQNGPAILERKFIPRAETTGSDDLPLDSKTVEAKEEIVTDKKQYYQIVSKKSFDEFPREVLNRYNSHGSFYYDEVDKRVKSSIVNSQENLPKVYYFKDDIDTLVLDRIDKRGKTMIISCPSKNLPGDFVDWLLRYNYRREFVYKETGTEVIISDIPDDQLEMLGQKIAQFGLKALKKEED